MSMRPWGPDVSHYQGTVNWPVVKAAGAQFAFVKATDGLTYVDPTFNRNWPSIYKAGILVRGAYHYAHIENDPVAEAQHYVITVQAGGGFHNGDFAVLDAEDICSASKKVDVRHTQAWIMAWLNEVVRLTGLKRGRVLVYTGAWWWGPRAGGSAAPALAGHPLWLAAYAPESRISFQPWRTWRFWQYTSSGRVPGINGNVDRNYFNGTYRGLWWLAGRPLQLFR